MLPGAQHLQNIHPLVIHFPIAFLMGAALLYVAAWLLKSDRFAQSAFVVLVLGAVSLAVAVATGLYAEQGVMVHLSVRTQLLAPHKRLMLVTSGLCAVLTGWAMLARPFPSRGRLDLLRNNPLCGNIRVSQEVRACCDLPNSGSIPENCSG